MVMAANDSPLHVIGGIGLESAGKNYIDATKSRAAVDLTQEQTISKKIENMSDRDKRRLESLVLASAELKPYLDAGDFAGAKNALLSRKRRLGAEIANGGNIDTRETDEAIIMVDKDPQQLKAIVDQTFQLGNTLGFFNKSNTPSDVQTALWYKNASADEKKAFDVTKRSQQVLNLGGTMGILAPGGDGLQQQFPVTLKPEDTPKHKQEAKEAEVVGADTGNARTGLAKAEDDAKYSMKLLDDLVAHPGLGYAVGKSSVMPIIPGTEAASFKSRLDQIGGRQFLAAFESLKGGGAITEIEGQKATDAIARLQRSNTEQEFINAAHELKYIIGLGLDRQRQKAGQRNTNDSAQSGANIPIPGLGGVTGNDINSGVNPGMRLPGASAPAKQGRVKYLGPE